MAFSHLFLALGLALMTPQSLFAKEKFEINIAAKKFQLENGLTVLLHVDQSIPMISYHTWYKVGSKDEKPGITGAAHMFEHMMFKGAKKYSGKDFDRTLYKNGISNNAFTSFDYTGFYETLPKTKLELVMDIEVDRMRDLLMRAEDLKTELQVVGEERRMRVDNSPSGALFEKLMSALFGQHPYGWPVIGHMKDVQAYTIEKLQPFYDQYYGPNNAVLVIAGDIDLDETERLVRKYYSDLKPRPVPERKIGVPVEITKKQKHTVKWNVQSPTVGYAWQGPSVESADVAPMDCLMAIIGEGTSSRLYKDLVIEKPIALGVQAYNYSLAHSGLLMISLSLKPGQSPLTAENRVRDLLSKMSKEKVTERELIKAKNQMKMYALGQLKTIDGKARALATNEILFGDYQRFAADLKRLDAVTLEDIERVREAYLNWDRVTQVVLEPKAGGAQ